jgi:hypothetical protein
MTTCQNRQRATDGRMRTDSGATRPQLPKFNIERMRLLAGVARCNFFAERFLMSDQEKEVQALENEFPAISGSAFAAARERALSAGHSVLESENGGIYEVFPDGRRIFVKKVAPPKAVVPGSVITIR